MTDPAREKLFVTRVGLVILILALLYLLWRIVAPVWQPLVWAMLVGGLLAPVNARLARRLGGRPKLASGLTTVGVVVLLLMPIVAIGGAVAAQAAQLLKRFEGNSLQLADLDLSNVPVLARPLQWFTDTTGVTLGRIRPEIEKLILYAAGESTVTVAHVRDVVIPREEWEDTFALMDAVRDSNAPPALREVSALLNEGVQPPVILGQLRAATIRLRP